MKKNKDLDICMHPLITIGESLRVRSIEEENEKVEPTFSFGNCYFCGDEFLVNNTCR